MLDSVYVDRNLLAQLVAALARKAGLHVGIAEDGTEPAWPVIYIDLPTGQVSWHISQDELVIQLSTYTQKWDGHSVEEKRERIRQFLLADQEQSAPA